MKAKVQQKKKQTESPMVYEALRNSIVSCEERIRNETINMYVIYFTMFSFGFTYNWLFMVSCIVLISFQSMINADRLSIEKASTYIRIFFEENRADIHWESLHKDASHLYVYNAEIKNIGWYFDKYGSAILAIFSFFSLLISVLKTPNISAINSVMISQLVITLVLVLIVIYMNCKYYINTGKKEDPISTSIQRFHQKCAKGSTRKMKASKRITDLEYEKLVKRLEFNDTMRNNLLTFSFTAVLTILGVALQINLDLISVWVCLLPFLLIIPFTARISYYRLSSAHIGAFLRIYARDRLLFETGANEVGEHIGVGKMFDSIAFLVNHEMVLLAAASSLVFYIKYIPCMNTSRWWDYIGLLIPIALIVLVFVINHSTNDYRKMVDNFKSAWE